MLLIMKWSQQCVWVLSLVTVALVIPIFIFSTTLFTIPHYGNKMLIDHNGRAGDAMAIFMALLYEKYFYGPKVIAITTSHGGITEEQAFRNTQRILDIAARRDIPIYRGLVQSILTNDNTPFNSSIDHIGRSKCHAAIEPILERETSAVSAIIEFSKIYRGELILVMLGALTNIAMAIRIKPYVLDDLAHIYIAAGNIQDERYPGPERNALMDVEAYYIVAEIASPDLVTLVPFSQTMDMEVSREWRIDTLGSVETEIMRCQNSFDREDVRHKLLWNKMSPVAMSIALNKSVVQDMRLTDNDIRLWGTDRGITTNTFTMNQRDANAYIVTKTNGDLYKQFLLDVFQAVFKGKLAGTSRLI